MRQYVSKGINEIYLRTFSGDGLNLTKNRNPDPAKFECESESLTQREPRTAIQDWCTTATPASAATRPRETGWPPGESRSRQSTAMPTEARRLVAQAWQIFAPEASCGSEAGTRSRVIIIAECAAQAWGQP